MKQDYKTRDRLINRSLTAHFKRMCELINQGMPKTEASKQAYDELMAGKLGKIDGKKRKGQIN